MIRRYVVLSVGSTVKQGYDQNEECVNLLLCTETAMDITGNKRSMGNGGASNIRT